MKREKWLEAKDGKDEVSGTTLLIIFIIAILFFCLLAYSPATPF
jgi:hypothetical protein